MSDITEDRSYIYNSVYVPYHEKLCANFIHCGNRVGTSGWYLAGAHYCYDCGQKTMQMFDEYRLSKTEVGKTVNGASLFKVRRCKE